MRFAVSMAVGCLVVTACSDGDRSLSDDPPPTDAPVVTDPRATTTEPGELVDLAAGARVSASRTLAGFGTELINDGIAAVPDGNFWSSGDSSPQWVEFELGTTATIHRVEMLTSQSPPGRTIHVLLGRSAADDAWSELARLDGTTDDDEWLVVQLDRPADGVRHLRVDTPDSPSWVAWGEVRIFGTPDGPVELPPRTSPAPAGDEIDDETLPAEGPDLILHGGPVVTVDADGTVATAVAVTDSAITAVGDADEILAMRGRDTVVVDLEGATVLPGFVDPHVHLVQSQTPDLEFMLDDQRILIESGRTSVGIPAVNRFNMDGFGPFDDEGLAILRMRLYIQYNDNCGERPEGDFWRTFDDLDPDPDDRLAIAGVKVFADGGSCNGPAVSWEYPPLPPDFRFPNWTGNGLLYVTTDELAAVLADTAARGGQVVVHVAGDRAVATGLDAIAAVSGDDGNPTRHRLDHNSIVPPDLRPRFGEVGAIPVVFADYDSCNDDPSGIWNAVAPAEVLPWLRANRQLIAANPGLPVAWHSDVPFAGLDVFRHLQALVTQAEVPEDGTYCPALDFLSGSVDVRTALRMMTWNAAYALRLEQHVGSVEPGKLADLVIVEANPLDQPSDELWINAVWATIIDGRVEYCGGPERLCAALTS